MLFVIGAAALALLGGAVIYLLQERLGPAGLGMALLRAMGVAALALLLVNPTRVVRLVDSAPTVLLDASLSMVASGGRWQEALDSARARAGASGVIWRFGSAVEPFDLKPPRDGRSSLREALAAARSRGGPVVVVTDGEIEDVDALEATLLEGVEVILLPRRRLPDVALVELGAPERVTRSDSLILDLTLELSGSLSADTGRVAVLLDGRRIATRQLRLPLGEGVIRREIVLPPGALPAGTHFLAVAVRVPGDSEPRNDLRWRRVTVASEPAIVVVSAPADWESRFFVREASQIVEAPLRAFAEIQAGQWIDLFTQRRVPRSEVEGAMRRASLVVSFGSPEGITSTRAQWRWLGGSQSGVFAGEWYVSEQVPSSPLAGSLAGLRWDSVPPLSGLVPLTPGESQWIVLGARLARRGVERPLVVARDSSGVRLLVTAGEGAWRWSFRGGLAREAYRALVAAGIDWLLGDGGGVRQVPLVVSSVVAQGAPLLFQWTGAEAPDSLVLEFSGDSSGTVTLRFDAQNRATFRLDPGSYRWRALPAGSFQGASGDVVVEEYSPEFRRRPITLAGREGTSGTVVELRRARERPWLFLLVILALAGEWFWRYRRGLP